MALKDWKIVKKGDYGKDYLQFKNQKTGEVLETNQSNIRNHFFVFVFANSQVKIDEDFRSKSQALAYAKSYMRNN